MRMKRIGADIFTVALDAVTPAIFDRTRGRGVDSPHRYDKYWQAIEWAAEIYGAEKFGAHLICGMGETEREILEVAQKIRDLGGHNHMFAFFPERGSLMEDWPAVDRGQWRRVQLARFLIDYRGKRVEDMSFDESGRVVDFGVPQEDPGAGNRGRDPVPHLGLPGQGRRGLGLQPPLRRLEPDRHPVVPVRPRQARPGRHPAPDGRQAGQSRALGNHIKSCLIAA